MKIIVFPLGVMLLLVSKLSFAVVVQCGVDERTAFLGELDPTAVCETGTGNPQKSVIDAYFGGDWNVAAELVGGEGQTGIVSDGVFSSNVTHGSWGSAPIGGTWSIASSFWDNNDSAVLSIHIGNGGGEPDHFAFGLLTANTTDGVFGVGFEWLGNMDDSWAAAPDKISGGGLSNFKLWAVPTPALLPLFAIGLLGLGFTRRCADA